MARIALRRLAHPVELGRYSPSWFFTSGYSSSEEQQLVGGCSLLRSPVLRDQRKCRLRDETYGKRTAHAASSALESTYGCHLPKVSDRIINVTLVSPVDGNRHNLKAMWGEGLTLLDSLKRAGVDTGCPCPVHEKGTEVCMGNCAVLVATEYLNQFPARTEEETEVIRLRLQTGAAAPPVVDKHIRLSCLLTLGPEHEGMSVGLTEPVAAETP